MKNRKNNRKPKTFRRRCVKGGRTTLNNKSKDNMSIKTYKLWYDRKGNPDAEKIHLNYVNDVVVSGDTIEQANDVLKFANVKQTGGGPFGYTVSGPPFLVDLNNDMLKILPEVTGDIQKEKLLEINIDAEEPPADSKKSMLSEQPVTPPNGYEEPEEPKEEEKEEIGRAHV